MGDVTSPYSYMSCGNALILVSQVAKTSVGLYMSRSNAGKFRQGKLTHLNRELQTHVV